jgi:CxxC motif-containing protein (DUF1111 family)
MMSRALFTRSLVAAWLALLLIIAGGTVGWAMSAGPTGASTASQPKFRPAVAPAFRQTPGEDDTAAAPLLQSLIEDGATLFHAEFTPEQGLGPLFNARSCVACHSSPTAGGMGPNGLGVALRAGRYEAGTFDPLIGRGGPFARSRSVAEFGYPCRVRPGIPDGANLTSVRNAPALYGLGLIDTIPDEAILAGVTSTADGVHGRPNLVVDTAGRARVGRFGWKADTATLHQFVGDAFRNELGITNPVAPQDHASSDSDLLGCAGAGVGPSPEAGDLTVDAVTAYIAALAAPQAQPTDTQAEGERLFRATGCAACHTPSLGAGEQQVPLYSDLLLHDMGSTLDDGVVQEQAVGRDWRTTPLWGLRLRERFLHDGRARTLQEAIQAHGGEASAATRMFRSLAPEERDTLLRFLGAL